MFSRRSISTAEDRISALPDSLICHILSFLPTKLAFATSILSKRWTPLWKSVTTLEFDDTSFPDFPSFRHFVYSIIISQDITLHLRSFCIRCGTSKNFDGRDINRFIHAAVQRRIENFELDLSYVLFCGQKYLTSGVHSIFCCSTLVVLKLGNLTVYEVPNLVDLPLLKTLRLDSVYFLCPFVYFMNLLRGCPILEDLHINFLTLFDICNDSVGEFKGLPKLVRANLYDSKNNFPFTWLHNAKFLRAELMSTYEYTVPTFHNLTHIELIFNSRTWKGKWKFVIQVLQHCPKLQNLTIVEAIDNILPIGDKDWTEPEAIPECLSSQLRKCSLFGFGGIECDLQFAEYILLNSKLLCIMTIRSSLWFEIDEKYPMLVKLSSYPRGSVTCKLLFD